MISYYRYVPHKHVASFMAAGWICTEALDGCHHGKHAVLMRACLCFKGGDHAR